MGLIDFFKKRKNKPLMLQAGKMTEEQVKKEEGEKVDVQIFSRKGEDNNIEYSIMLNIGEESVLVGRVYSSQHIELKRIANKIKDAIEPITNAENEYSINRTKQEAKEKLQRIVAKEGIILTEEIMQYLNQYRGTNDNRSNQNDIHKKMDMNDIVRLQELETIKTPEDAYQHKDSLIAYMQRTEKVPINPIVEANIKSLQEGEKLDDETVKRIAENMEKLGNEDGLLYSVYLKIEEKRIWKQLQTTLAQYSNASRDEKVIGEIYELSGLIDKLDKYELPDMSQGFSESVLGYMFSQMEETDIGNYIENVKKKDTSLARTINTKCPDIQNKIEMLQFLYARIGSLGQLSYKSALKGNEVLRNFIASTGFKHEDNTETKQFLLTVANIEKENIQKKYITINLEEYSNSKNLSFKERMNVKETPVINIVDRQKVDSKYKQDGERTA